MMKSFDTELAKYAAKTRLKAAERAELRDRILSYMEYHPLPKTVGKVSKIAAPPRRFGFAFNSLYARVAAGVFAVVLILVGVPFAAEQSVPGDILYPIKTDVNESIRAQFVDTPYEKIAFETELMERRIAEARLLEKEGKLTDETEAKLAEDVKGHATAAWEGIAELNATDAEEGAIAKITFGSALDVQSALFQGEGDDSNATTGIAGVVNAAKASVAADRSTSTPSYERLSARVESETTRAHELRASIDGAATDDEHTQIDRRLSDIDTKIKTAQVAHETSDGEAVPLLSEALGDIQKLISFMTDIDVRENASLDDLVPVVLTPEERIVKLEEILASSTPDTEGTSTEATSTADTEFSTTLSGYIDNAKSLLLDGKIRDALTVIGEAEQFTAGSTTPTDVTGEVEGAATSTEATATTESEDAASGGDTGE